MDNTNKSELNPKGPSFFLDWGSSLFFVWEGVKKCPLAASALLLVSAADGVGHALRKGAWYLGLVDMIVISYVSYFIIMQMSQAKTGDANTAGKDMGVIRTVILVGLALLISVTVLLILLVVPGLWWGTVSSLVIVVACLEKGSFADCFRRSRELVGGHFWLAVRYAWLGPMVLLAFWFIPTHIYWLWEGVSTAKSPISIVRVISAVVEAIGANILGLSFVPPSVLLFWYLLDKKAANETL